MIELITNLNFATKGQLPVESLRLANAHRSDLIPLFLDEIGRFRTTTPDQRENSALFFMFHLLGSWRAIAAYRHLAQFLRHSPHDLQSVLGDATTVSSHRVMINVFDGDPEPLHAIILDPDADGFVRSRMLQGLAVLTLQNRIGRRDTAGFLRSCFVDLQPKKDCAAWLGWQSAIAMLGLDQLQLLVKQAFDRGSIDPTWITYDHFVSDLQKTIEGHSALSCKEFAPFGDTIEELSTWSSFRELP